MKNSYIIIIVLVLLIVGGIFLSGTGKKAEAPISDTQTQTDTQTQIQTETDTATATPVEQAPKVKEFVISGKNFSFSPSLITVQKGDKVKIVFENTAGFHDFVIDEYGLATKQAKAPATEILEFTADKAGSFEYYCSVGTHRDMGMKGTLVVQ
ncbi:MAG: cupredoxin domain-containing protein [Minisyncoccia bacterium]